MSEENIQENCLHDYDVKNGALQFGLIKYASNEGNPKSAAEERKEEKRKLKHHRKATTKEESTSEDQEEDEHYESVSARGHMSRKEERGKDKYHKKSTSEEKSSSEDQEGDECKSAASHVSRKGEKLKEKRREPVSDNDLPAKEYKRKDYKHQKKSKAVNKETDKDHGSTLSYQPVDDFAFAENQGSVKHIVILGTIGSGKYTIAKNISTNSRNFPSRSSLRESGKIIQYIDDGNRFKFVLVDTGGARMPDVWGAKGPTIGSIAAQIKEYLKGGISLIMVVVRYDCDTLDDIQVLVNMINGLFTSEAKKHIALIHNGCEILSNENVLQYIGQFKADGPSRKLSSLCHKGIVATGFPSLKEVKFEMRKPFEQAIEQSKSILSALVESCKFLQPYSGILKANNDPSGVFPEVKPDCCVM